MSKEQDDLMKGALARALNCDVSEVGEFRDEKTHKKRKKKSINSKKSDNSNIIKSNEGLQLIGTDVKYIDYKDIPKSKLFNRELEHVFNWDKAKDFVIFTFNVYEEKFEKSLDLKIPSSCNEINKIRDDLYNIIGISSPLIVRDYILFCFENYIPEQIRNKKKFYFSNLRNQFFMINFSGKYNYKSSLDKEYNKLRKEIKLSNKKLTLKEKEIEQSYILSDIGFVCNYGIIIAINWLIIKKKIIKANAIKKVLNICLKIWENGVFEIVKNSTENFSPYPKQLVFGTQQDIRQFLEKINKNLKINIKFISSERLDIKFAFVKEKNEKTLY